jgi:hypothetical protein
MRRAICAIRWGFGKAASKIWIGGRRVLAE